jgi:SpoVK/Ycf46/Vps4 family AAA+-type ATPase
VKVAGVASAVRQDVHARAPVTVALIGASSVEAAHSAALLAGEIGRRLHRIDLSAVVSKYIGETEKNLDALFQRAEAEQWVLFFDEADALFGKRSDVKDAHDRYANVAIDYLLQRMESYAGLVVLATNDEHRLRRVRSRRRHVVPPR